MNTLTRTTVASLLASGLILVPGTAMAHGPDACTGGPTRLADANKPHIVDVEGDGADPWKNIHGKGTDVIGGWVTGPSAWEDRESTAPFTGHMRMEALEQHPVNGIYYFQWRGARGQHYVSAQAKPDGTWAYSYGWLDQSMTPNRFTNLGSTTGRVNMAAGVISLDLPAAELPARPTDGSALTFELVNIDTRILTGSPDPLPVVGLRGLVHQVDVATDLCEVILYERDPALPPPPEE